MASTYTVNLGIEKIGTGEQSGTWGTTTNTNFDLIDQAINGAVTVTLASAGTSGVPNTLAITDGTVSDGRNKFIDFADGGDLGAAAYIQLTPNDAEKLVHIRNSLSGGRSIFVFQGTYNASNDFEIPNGKDVVLKFDGGGATATVTQVFEDLLVTAVAATTVDTTNIEVTNLKAKDGTSAGSIADSTGVVTLASSVLTTTDINGGSVDGVTLGTNSAVTEAQIDNININGNTISSTDTNGNVTITPDGTGSVAITKIDVAGGEIDGTAIGANSASTAVFTDLTASGTVSFSGATVSNGGSVTTIDINGGNIDGTIIGAATPAAGSFTTFTSNGIDDNASATAVTLDASGNVGIGTASPDAQGGNQSTILNLEGSDNLVYFSGGSGGNAIDDGLAIEGVATGVSSGDKRTGSILMTRANTSTTSLDSKIAFYTTSSGTHAERMRIDSSGNVGIGVTPSAWSSIFQAVQIGDGDPAFIAGRTDGPSQIHIGVNGYYAAGGPWKYINADYATRYYQSFGAHYWETASSGVGGDTISFSEVMRIDSSGNLLLGETNVVYLSRATFAYDPTTTNGPIAVDTRSFGINHGGVYYMGGKYDTAGNYRAYAGVTGLKENGTDGNSAGYMAFYTNGNAADPAERARITSDGSLLVGGTTAESKVNIYTGGSTFSSGTMPAGMTIYSTTIDGQGSMLSFKANPGAQGIAGIAGVRSSGWETELRFYTNNTASQDAFSERMRIDSSGNLGLGVAPTANDYTGAMQLGYAGHGLTPRSATDLAMSVNAYHSGGAWKYGSTNPASLLVQSSNFSWYTAASGTADTTISFGLKMQLDSSGALLVGTTTSAGAGGVGLTGSFRAGYQGVLNGYGNENVSGLFYSGSSSGGYTAINSNSGNAPLYVSLTSSATTGALINFADTGTGVGYIGTNGTTTSYNTSSDARLKENIADAEDASNLVDAIKVRQFDWKTDGSHQRYGMVAQELLEVAPEAVSGDPESDDMMGVDYSKLVPMLVKEIQSLRARLHALESK